MDQVVAYTNEIITLNDIHEVNGTISQENVAELINNTVDNKLSDVINKITEYSNRGKSIVKITEEIILFLRNSILFKTTSNFIEDKKNIYREINNKISTEKMLEYISIMNESLLDIKKFSNPKMILELAFIKLIDVKKVDDKVVAIDEKEEIIKSEIEKETTIISQNFNVKEEKKKDNIETKNDKLDNNSNDEIIQKLNQFVEIRVNNTLSKFSKKETLEFKNTLKKVMDYVMDEKYNIYATMILDGELKAVSDEYAIFTYTTAHLSNLFNENITNIENLINEIFSKHYKVVAVDLEKWNIIKEDFNSKKKKFEYQNEEITIDEIISKLNKDSIDDIQSLFGEIVEYN